jgi:hypothetical protein
MRRKTAPKDPVHPEVSRAAASEVGLIAKAEEWAQSAVGECVLDNRSHRTDQGSGVRGRRASLSLVKPWTAPDPLQPIVRPRPHRVGKDGCRERFRHEQDSADTLAEPRRSSDT